MKKFMLLGTLVALVVAALALPAVAQDRYEDIWNGFEDRYEDSYGDLWDDFEDRYEDRFEEQGFAVFGEDEGRFFDGGSFFAEEEDGLFFAEEEDDFVGAQRFEEDDFFGVQPFADDGFDGGINQSFDQEAESGDVSQSFDFSNKGDNSNSCYGVSSVVNTGNAQNQTGIIQYGSEAGDFEFEDSGATINVGGSSTTTCDQEVNQAASAG